MVRDQVIMEGVCLPSPLGKTQINVQGHCRVEKPILAVPKLRTLTTNLLVEAKVVLVKVPIDIYSLWNEF